MSEPSFLVPAQPRLRWRHLLGPRRPTPVPGPPGARLEPVFWGRSALFHGLHALGLSGGDGVLVPAFHCASVVDPILRAGLRVTFYRIDRDGMPDLDDISRRIDVRTRALLIIHYFGFPQPIRALRRLANEQGLSLIEDCAHVLLGHDQGEPFGAWGDIAVFSWRKFLPVYDGAFLVLNHPRLGLALRWERETLLLRLKVLYNLLEPLVAGQSPRAASRSGRRTSLLSLVGRFLLRQAGDSRALAVRNYGTEFDPAVTNLRMSALSRHVMSRLDLPAIVERRRLNFLHLLKAVRSLPGVVPFVDDLPDGVCPLALPIIAEKPDFHLDLRARGIPAVSWGGVIHPDFPEGSFPDAEFLYRHLVLLPIHQDLGQADLDAIVGVIQRALLDDR